MEDERNVLPLKEAYRFGAEHGLEREMAEIRDMEIEWDLYVHLFIASRVRDRPPYQ